MMFIGRREELGMLDRFYDSGRFEFLVLYGRRRIGKTFLLREFAKNHDCIFFSAMEKNDRMNLEDFSSVVQTYFSDTYLAPFADWKKAFEYIGSKAEKRKVCLIIDEFPFLVKENPTIKSILQHQIDHIWLDLDIKLVLCGSNISVMENDVLGYESPLYGRSTIQWELQEFDYLDASEFFPGYTEKEKLIAYGILGGIPRYLTEFNPKASLRDNIRDRILSPGAFLREEPTAYLKMAVREPSLYNSIMETIAKGTNRLNEIASAIHEEQTKVGKYMKTLQNLRLITRIAPSGEPRNGKKSIYTVTDKFFTFWYRFMSANNNHLDLIGPEAAADEILDNINDYMGPIFESISEQFLKKEAKSGALPFIPYSMGRWWGNNPKLKAQDDIDILIMDKERKSAVLSECKFKNSPFDSKDLDDILDSLDIFPALEKFWIYIFSLSGWTEEVERKSKLYNIRLITAEDFFRRT